MLARFCTNLPVVSLSNFRDGKTLVTRPISNAYFASRFLPVMIISVALPNPIKRGSNQLAPLNMQMVHVVR
ncbi:MAG: hypothetical protein ACTSUN_09830 [Promethearchaeota archaeon]